MLEDENKNNLKDFSQREEIVFEIYKRLNRSNLHKMQAIPVCQIHELL